LFVTHLLYRNIRYEADLVDQLFNSGERRLARILLLLAHFGKESKMESVVPMIAGILTESDFVKAAAPRRKALRR
jgi:CRP/FNR family transcriptional regulator, cyclic AMP receptor protein